jgi:hypothetical protein
MAFSLIYDRSLDFDQLSLVGTEDAKRTTLTGFDLARSVYHDVRPNKGHIDYGHID